MRLISPNSNCERRASAPSPRGRRPFEAFTMIEIALSLAVIAFALVAIIGVLPLGMDVQKENREETIIDQDATVLMEAIRNGAQGLEDLTNYVIAITNYSTYYQGQARPVQHVYGYTPEGSFKDNGAMAPSFPLTSGFRIVGLLSTPKYIQLPTVKGQAQFYSNHVVAYFRSLSGNASDKFPQNNPDLRNLAFSYRIISEIIPFSGFDQSWINYQDPAIQSDTNQVVARSNYWMYAKNLQPNLNNVRLLFSWPLLPTGRTGNGRQVFSAMASGAILVTNDFDFPSTPDTSSISSNLELT